MNNFTSLLRQCLLAIALAGTALGAAANPISYQVNLNTAGLVGGTMLDFLFTRIDGAAPTTATVTNLSGAINGPGIPGGNATLNADGSFTIGTGGADAFNYVDFLATFGGPFSLNVTFSDDFLSGLAGFGSTFSISVVNDNFAPVTGGDGLVVFDLSSDGGIVVDALAGNRATLIDPNAVPEPSSILMMLTGLGLVGFMVRRRKAPVA